MKKRKILNKKLKRKNQNKTVEPKLEEMKDSRLDHKEIK